MCKIEENKEVKLILKAVSQECLKQLRLLDSE